MDKDVLIVGGLILFYVLSRQAPTKSIYGPQTGIVPGGGNRQMPASVGTGWQQIAATGLAGFLGGVASGVANSSTRPYANPAMSEYDMAVQTIRASVPGELSGDDLFMF